LFVLIGALQAIACCTGDLIIGIQCTHVWAFYLSAIVASFAFVNIIFGLSVAFKHLGKALAFTLIILQVPGSSGMYPIEMMPPFFQAIGPWLPFTYSNNAMREAIGGFYGSNLAYNLGMLLLFVVPSILVGVAARAHLVNVNALFDQRLRDTHHLLVSEPVAMEGNHYRLATVVKALHSPKEYREELDARSAAFERMYPSLVRRGLLLLLLLPLGIFALIIGGLLGTKFIERVGLRSALWPMAVAMLVPSAIYCFLSSCQPSYLFVVSCCIFAEQLAYGFGFAAYLVLLGRLHGGELKKSLMALSLMLPCALSGLLAEQTDYHTFFMLTLLVGLASLASVHVVRRDDALLR
jgi:hypothetical protein